MNLNETDVVPADVIGLLHRVTIPAEATLANPAPLLLMVHGYAGDENVMWIFKRAVPKGMAIITPRAILDADEGSGYQWFDREGDFRINPKPDSLEAALIRLEEFISALPKHYPVDIERLVVAGFSQGAAMCNSYVLRNPNSVRGVASLAGAMPVEIPGIEPYDGLLADLPVFIAHGTEDEILPIKLAHYTRNTYQQLGAKVTYGEYPVGHKMSSQAIKDLQAWLWGIMESA